MGNLVIMPAMANNREKMNLGEYIFRSIPVHFPAAYKA